MTENAAPETDQARPNTEGHQQLLRKLFAELFQAERSASRHGRREAKRYESAPPARSLRTVAEHAERELRELTALARLKGMQERRVGALVGESFSLLREFVGDRLVDAERSYRGTLLGMRHGIDLVDLIRRVADACGQVEVGGFCTRWLDERQPLVNELAQGLSWFAANPERAAEMPRPRLLRRIPVGRLAFSRK
jgi:hypothetical protein